MPTAQRNMKQINIIVETRQQTPHGQVSEEATVYSISFQLQWTLIFLDRSWAAFVWHQAFLLLFR
jgi:hypothetical protein